MHSQSILLLSFSTHSFLLICFYISLSYKIKYCIENRNIIIVFSSDQYYCFAYSNVIKVALVTYYGLYHTNISHGDMYEGRNLSLYKIFLFTMKGFDMAHFCYICLGDIDTFISFLVVIFISEKRSYIF